MTKQHGVEITKKLGRSDFLGLIMTDKNVMFCKTCEQLQEKTSFFRHWLKQLQDRKFIFTQQIINLRNAEPVKLVAEKALQSLNKEWLCELDKKKGLDIRETYIADKKCAEFISFVGSVEQRHLKIVLRLLHFSPYYVMI
ncbi:hypothetical protein PR048_019567 [Dryococelus australis]|uniref:Uncharacterized protein n=1 Tax=Dryococelus australis TaxID=614101 RepID=A0ABQ9H464_9NEOP|nr:hypothetical protein PR048_019567 [Dryococelus australis]